MRSRPLRGRGGTTKALLPEATPRRVFGQVSLPGKAIAVIGMRRAGKTTYVYQLRRERMELGTGREQLSYLNFEDERLAGLTAAHLEDCFLVRMVWMESASERQRMVNPRRGARRGTGRCHGAADLRMAADSADLILEEGREEKRQGEGERPEPLLTGFAGDSQAQHGRRTSPG